MNEKFELSCFQIITYVGTARTHFINAIHCAKEGKYDEAAELIKQGDEAFFTWTQRSCRSFGNGCKW